MSVETTTPARRELTFRSLNEIMPEVDRLLAGHRTVGNWTLGQICNHLAAAIQRSVEGFPIRAPWLIRQTMGRRARRELFREGRMKAGVKLPDEYCPKPGLDARAEAEALRASLALFANATGPLADHPFFGHLSADEWSRLHCMHCAHHLGYAIPDA